MLAWVYRNTQILKTKCRILMKNASGMQWTLLLEGDVFYLTMTNSENSTTNLHRHIKRLIGSVYSECEGSWKPPLVEICRTESVCVCVCAHFQIITGRTCFTKQKTADVIPPPPCLSCMILISSACTFRRWKTTEEGKPSSTVIKINSISVFLWTCDNPESHCWWKLPLEVWAYWLQLNE